MAQLRDFVTESRAGQVTIMYMIAPSRIRAMIPKPRIVQSIESRFFGIKESPP